MINTFSSAITRRLGGSTLYQVPEYTLLVEIDCDLPKDWEWTESLSFSIHFSKPRRHILGTSKSQTFVCSSWLFAVIVMWILHGGQNYTRKRVDNAGQKYHSQRSWVFSSMVAIYFVCRWVHVWQCRHRQWTALDVFLTLHRCTSAWLCVWKLNYIKWFIPIFLNRDVWSFNQSTNSKSSWSCAVWIHESESFASRWSSDCNC